GRPQRLVDRHGHDCAERGYLLVPVAMQHEAAGDHEAAYAAASAAAELGERFRDMDLFSLALHTQGRALIRQGRVAAGLALLDEAMLPATAGGSSSTGTRVGSRRVLAGWGEGGQPPRAPGRGGRPTPRGRDPAAEGGVRR